MHTAIQKIEKKNFNPERFANQDSCEFTCKISFGAEKSSKGLQEKKFQILAKFKKTLSYKFEGVPKFDN